MSRAEVVVAGAPLADTDHDLLVLPNGLHVRARRRCISVTADDAVERFELEPGAQRTLDVGQTTLNCLSVDDSIVVSAITSECPPGALVHSGTAQALQGARAAVLRVGGLFRLDVSYALESLAFHVRQAAAVWDVTFDSAGYPLPVDVRGEHLGELQLHPGHHEITFQLRDTSGAVAIVARVNVALLRSVGNGRMRIIARVVTEEGSC